MITTGTIAKALRKNTTCPTGIVSPKPRMSADITPNSSSDASLSAIPLAMLERDLGAARRAAVVRGCESLAPSAAPGGGCVRASLVGSVTAKVRVSCAQQPARSCYFFVGWGPAGRGTDARLAASRPGRTARDREDGSANTTKREGRGRPGGL